MRKLCVLLVCMCFFACSDSDDSGNVFNIDSFPQRWELTTMTGSIRGAVFEGDQLPWQESINLKGDGSFIKVRLIDNQTLQGAGIFVFSEENDQMFLTLEFDSETELIESCSREKITESFLMPTANLLNGGSAPCDGPGLFYIK